jgi:hypothetical protein
MALLLPPLRASPTRARDVRIDRSKGDKDSTNLLANIPQGMAILHSKKTDIEKYQYLSVLRNTNVHLFYRLLSENVKVSIVHSHEAVLSAHTHLHRK